MWPIGKPTQPILIKSDANKQDKAETPPKKTISDILFEKKSVSTTSRSMPRKIGTRRDSRFQNRPPTDDTPTLSEDLNFNANSIVNESIPPSSRKTISEQPLSEKEEQEIIESDPIARNLENLLDEVRSLSMNLNESQDPSQGEILPNTRELGNFEDPEVQASEAESLGSHSVDLPSRTSRLRLNELQALSPERDPKATRRAAGNLPIFTRGLHKRGNTAVQPSKIMEDTRASFAAVRRCLPEGVKMDNYGNLSGTTELLKVPCAEEDVDRSPQKPILFEVHLNQRANTLLERTRPVENQEIAQQAFQDIQSLDIEFIYKNGDTFRARENKPNLQGTTLDPQKELKKIVVAALQKFAKSPFAVTTLSAVLNQNFLTGIWRNLSSSDGNPMPHLRLISKSNANDRTLFLVQEDGTLKMITDTRGISGAKLTFVHEGDNFKLILDWQAYAEAEPRYADLLPLAKDTVIGIHFRAEFLIHGPAAHSRKMDLAIDYAKATFSGRLKL